MSHGKFSSYPSQTDQQSDEHCQMKHQSDHTIRLPVFTSTSDSQSSEEAALSENQENLDFINRDPCSVLKRMKGDGIRMDLIGKLLINLMNRYY